jgi:hypothetical protein
MAKQIESRAINVEREQTEEHLSRTGRAEKLRIAETSKWLSEGSSLLGYRVAGITKP